jgi:hypothetical protein
MAAMNTTFTTSRNKLTAERVARYAAEQRRLKAAAASRRAASAAGTAGESSVPATPERLSARTRRSQYLG